MANKTSTVTLRIQADSNGAVRVLGSDVDKINRKLADGESRALRWGNSFAKAGNLAANAGKIIGSGIAIGVAALTKMTTSSISAGDEVVRLAKIADASNVTFQRWAAGANTVGIGQEKLADILKDVNDKVGDFLQTGGGGMADFFENIAPAVGVTADQFKKLSGPQALQLYVSSLEKAGVSQNEMTFYMEALASDATALLPLLRNGGEEMRRWGDAAEEAGAVMDDEMITQMRELKKETQLIDLQLTGLRNNIVQQMVPEIKEFAKAVNSPEFKEGFSEIAKGAATATTAVVGFLGAVANATSRAGEFWAEQFNGPIIDNAGQARARVAELQEARSHILFDLGGEGARIDAEIEKWQGLIATWDRLAEIAGGTAEETEAVATAAGIAAASLGNLAIQTEKSVAVTEAERKAAEAAAKAREEAAKIAERAAREQERLAAVGAQFVRQTEQMAASLGGPLAQAQFAFSDGVNQASDALGRGEIGIAAYVARLGVLGKQYVVATKDIKSASEVIDDFTKDLKADYAVAIRMAGLSEKARRIEAAGINAVAEAQERLSQAGGGVLSDDVAETIRETTEANESLLETALELDDILRSLGGETQLEQMLRELNAVNEALERGADAAGNAYSPERINELRRAQGNLRQETLEYATGAVGQGIASLQSMAGEGTKAYKALETAQLALNVVTAIGAVLNQGKSDPYTAFARMAAMAAAVAALVGNIAFSGGSGGPSRSSAEFRQENQGTGTVLGDVGAKSESIANAVEITADATSELVGINRGMLSALQAMQAGISGASNRLAQGAGDIIPAELSQFSLTGIGVIDNILGSIFGGDQELIDSGVRIMGGTLGDMIENIMAQTYQTIETDGGWFHSDSTDDVTQAMSDAVTTQLQLVLDSLADAVREGARALGLNMDEVNAAIEAYRIQEIRISTMDLSAEEAQAELEAVFSSIFDGLAGSIVPFIDQFQRAGEGLGETLIRVATQVQVVQEGIGQLGWTLDDTLGPEQMAQVSDGLIQAVGSIGDFISGMQSFVANFAPEGHAFAIAQDELTRALSQVGLAVPETRDAMWELMQSLDATTAAGQEQIATLLRLAGFADDYYDGLEDQQQDLADAAREALEAQQAMIDELTAGIANLERWSLALRISNADLSDFATAMLEATDWRSNAIREANDHARAAGLAAAREGDLAQIELRAASMRAQAIAEQERAIAELTAQLGYTDAPDTLDYLNQQIDALQNASLSAAEGISSAVDTMREQLGLLLGDLSPYNDNKKLEIARAGLQSGTVTQEQFLTIAQRLFGNTDRYRREFDFALQYPGQPQQVSGGAGGSFGLNTEDGRSLAELIEARDALLAEQRTSNAFDLADRIAELSGATGEDFGTLAERMGFTLDQLGEDLGFTAEALNEYLSNIGAQFNQNQQQYAADSIVSAIEVQTANIVAAIRGEPLPWMTLPIPDVMPSPGPVSTDNGKRADEASAMRAEVSELRAELRAYLAEIANSSARGAEAGEQIAVNTGNADDQLGRLRRDVGEGAPTKAGMFG